MRLLREINSANIEAGKISDDNEVIRIIIDDNQELEKETV